MDRTYEDEYIKERIEELRIAQKEAAENGKILVSSYEQFWLPALNDLPDVEFQGGIGIPRRMENSSRFPMSRFMARCGSRHCLAQNCRPS
jgi:hypothetical protein